MFHRGVIITLTTVAAVHAALLYPLLAQQAEPVQAPKKRVVQGIVLVSPAPQTKKPEETQPTPPTPDPKKEVVQEPVKHPAPAPIEKPIKEIVKSVLEETIETSAPQETVQQHVAEPVEKLPQSQPDSDVEEFAITPPRIGAAGHLENPPPSYPRLSKRLREEGVVILELWILEDGTAAEITVKTSSGYPRLDKAALTAVSKWRYTPATRNGEVVAYRYEQPIEFALK